MLPADAVASDRFAVERFQQNEQRLAPPRFPVVNVPAAPPLNALLARSTHPSQM
jgi:hypothetical protein